MENLEITSPKEIEIKGASRIFVEESSKEPYDQEHTEKESLEKLKKTHEKNNLHVAKLRGQVVGFIIFVLINNKNKKRAYMDELWIKSNYQGKGIGKELVKFFENFCKEKGVEVADLISHREANAYEFYKKRGYSESDEFVFMSKNL